MKNDMEKIMVEAEKVKKALELLLKVCEVYYSVIEYAEFDDPQNQFPTLEIMFYSEMDRIAFLNENLWLRRVRKLSTNIFKTEPKIQFTHNPF